MYSKLFEFIPFYLILAKFGIYYSALFMPKILIFNYNIFILFSRKKSWSKQYRQHFDGKYYFSIMKKSCYLKTLVNL